MAVIEPAPLLPGAARRWLRAASALIFNSPSYLGAYVIGLYALDFGIYFLDRSGRLPEWIGWFLPPLVTPYVPLIATFLCRVADVSAPWTDRHYLRFLRAALWANVASLVLGAVAMRIPRWFPADHAVSAPDPGDYFYAVAVYLLLFHFFRSVFGLHLSMFMGAEPMEAWWAEMTLIRRRRDIRRVVVVFALIFFVAVAFTLTCPLALPLVVTLYYAAVYCAWRELFERRGEVPKAPESAYKASISAAT